MAAENKDYINQMYDSSLASQTAQLETDYKENQANLEAEQENARKQTDANLVRTYVEAAKAQKNYNEVQNAYGLTSGAMAQARLAQDNQLQADMTTIRAAQQTVDADVERQKTLLAQQYSAAIAKAKADNDIQRAQALYEDAKQAEADLLQKQKEAASLMAGVGDYSLYQILYGLTDEQMALLQGTGSSDGVYYPAPGDGSGIGTNLGDMMKNVAASAVENALSGLGAPKYEWGSELNPRSYALVKQTLSSNLNKGNYDAAEKYLTQLYNEKGVSESQYNELLQMMVGAGYQ